MPTQFLMPRRDRRSLADGLQTPSPLELRQLLPSIWPWDYCQHPQKVSWTPAFHPHCSRLAIRLGSRVRGNDSHSTWHSLAMPLIVVQSLGKCSE
eukprot:5854845-Amphidinium_carterae.1